MSRFDARFLEHLKKLCRIDCTAEEEAILLEDLNRALAYIDQLSELKTEGVNPCNYVLRAMLRNRMREDRVADLLSREAFLSNAPDQVGGMIRIPPVLKSNG